MGLPKDRETELKLRCMDPSTWEGIMSAQSLTKKVVPKSQKREMLETHYFDTATCSLQKASIAYRIRREGDQWIATVKGGGSSSGGLHERQEWNVLVNDPQPDIAVFDGTAIGKRLLAVVGNEKLQSILLTRFERRQMDVIMPDGSQIEVAADQGEVIAGVKRAPILEVELELKSGEVASLFRLGAELAREFPLLPEAESKYYRGIKLAGKDTTQTKQPYQLPQVDKNKLVSEELSKALLQLIGQYLENQQNFLDNPALSENIHEMRISLRRIRSVLDFAGALATKQYKWYLTELKKFARMLAALREFDVAYASWRQVNELQILKQKSKINLGEYLCKNRQLEAEKLYRVIIAGYATPLLLELQAALLESKGQQVRDESTKMNEYAISRLANWLKILTKLGKKVNWIATEDLHKVRLQVKKIKYVAEIMQTAFYEVPQLVLRLDALQENLGYINDVYSTDSLLKVMLEGNEKIELYLEAGMVIGWQEREALLVKHRMDKYWQNFYRTAQRWI